MGARLARDEDDAVSWGTEAPASRASFAPTMNPLATKQGSRWPLEMFLRGQFHVVSRLARFDVVQRSVCQLSTQLDQLVDAQDNVAP